MTVAIVGLASPASGRLTAAGSLPIARASPLVQVAEGRISLRPHRSAVAKVIEEWRKDPVIPDPERARALADEAFRLLDESRDEDHLDRSYLDRDA